MFNIRDYKVNSSLLERNALQVSICKSITQFIQNNPDSGFKSTDTAIAMLLDGDQIYYLNFTAAVIWEQIKSGKSFEEITRLVATLFSQDSGVVQLDIIEFLAEMIDKRFLVKRREWTS